MVGSSKNDKIKKKVIKKSFNIKIEDIIPDLSKGDSKNGSKKKLNIKNSKLFTKNSESYPNNVKVDTLKTSDPDESDIYKEVGAVLKNARLSIGVTLEEIAESSKVRMEYLQMVEDGLREDVLKLTYYQGCVRILARFANVDVNEIMLQITSADMQYRSIVHTSAGGPKENKRACMNQKILKTNRNDAIKKEVITLFIVVIGLFLIVGWVKGDNSEAVGNRFLEEIEAVNR
ncbi:MAG: helix-turn-helix domain-containing protein [Alphaproteobacteria bacterium]|nr:helix-turn-helix domain-containing protein [Rickettsiales bacterium]